ncbi:MAG: putative transposase, partial [Planctomycetota bacterium]
MSAVIFLTRAAVLEIYFLIARKAFICASDSRIRLPEDIMKQPPTAPPLGKCRIESPDIVDINERVWFLDQDSYRVVFYGQGIPLYRASLANPVEVRHLAVALRQSDLARQHEIARAFGHSEKTQRRWERCFEKDGLEGLQDKRSSGRPAKIPSTQETRIRQWFTAHVPNAEMASRLAVNEATVRRALKRLGLKRMPKAQTAPLFVDSGDDPPLSVPPQTVTDEAGVAQVAGIPVVPELVAHETPEPPTPPPAAALSVGTAQTVTDEAGDAQAAGTPVVPELVADQTPEPPTPPPAAALSVGADPLDRSLDRAMARLGLLFDPEPIFAPAEGLPRAGAFLAVPVLVAAGVLDIFKDVYHHIGPAFYGLRTTVVCMLFMALLRIKRPENIKEYNPVELGRLLGLDRAPEVKTIRRQLDALARRDCGMTLTRCLAQRRVERQPEIVGYLYVDSHVKEYCGKYPLAKIHITRRHRSLPAATDTWVNDVHGDPVFVVPSDMNEELFTVLAPVLAEVRQWVGPDREITVVFDRGGWSQKLFQKLLDAGFHL